MIVLGRSPSVMEAIHRLAELRRSEPPDSPVLAEAAQRGPPGPRELHRDLRLPERPAVRPRRQHAAPAHARPGPRHEPADRPAQGQRAGRGLRPRPDAAPGRRVRLPGLSRPERAGGVHRRPGVRHDGRDRRLSWRWSWATSEVFRAFTRLQRPGRDRRGDGRPCATATRSRSSPRRVTTRTRRSNAGYGSAATEATAMQAAVQGERGYGEMIDYRGDHGGRRLVVPAVVPLGHGRQAGRRRGVRADPPASGMAIGAAPGRDGRDRRRRRAAGGAVDLAADPRGRAGGRARRRRRPDGHGRRPATGEAGMLLQAIRRR